MVIKGLQGHKVQFQMGIEGSSHLTTITIGQGVIVGKTAEGKSAFLQNDVTKGLLHNGIFIVESKIAKLYPEMVAAIPSSRLHMPEVSESYEVSSEGIKGWDALEGVLSFLLQAHTTRETPVVSIGGGALTDIAGLASSIYMRGTPLYTIPTTLLGMVDSSIGGKTGINFQDTKNVIGTFHHPAEVLVDINFLQTLSSIEIVSGLMEVVKLGIALDCDLFTFVESHLSNILDLDSDSITHIVTRSLTIKGETVRIDAFDQNERLKLNFGHTIAHPIESDSEFTIPHGMAVGMGMYWELCLAEFLVERYGEGGEHQHQHGDTYPVPLRAAGDVGDAAANNGKDNDSRQISDFSLTEIRGVRGDLKKILDRVGINPEYKPRNQRRFIETLRNDKKNLPNRILLPLIQRGGRAVVMEVAVSDVADFCAESIFCTPQSLPDGKK